MLNKTCIEITDRNTSPTVIWYDVELDLGKHGETFRAAITRPAADLRRVAAVP